MFQWFVRKELPIESTTSHEAGHLFSTTGSPVAFVGAPWAPHVPLQESKPRGSALPLSWAMSGTGFPLPSPFDPSPGQLVDDAPVQEAWPFDRCPVFRPTETFQETDLVLSTRSQSLWTLGTPHLDVAMGTLVEDPKDFH